MQVAVACMAERAHAHAGALADFDALAHERRDVIARHDDVALVHRGRAALDGLQERAARIPDALLALVRIGQQHVLGADGQRQVGQRVHRGGERLAAGAVQAHEQVSVRAGIRELLAQVLLRAGDDLALHELHGRRIAAAGQHLRHRLDAGLQVVKRHEQREVDLRLRHELDGQLGEEAQRALGADHQVDEAVAARGLDGLAAQRDEPAVGQRNLHAQHIVARDAVAHGAHAAGVGHGVAAHRRGLLARVRRIEQARTLQRLGELHQQHARLHGRGHVAGIHLQHALHALGGEHHAAVDGDAAAAQAGARAARGDGDLLLVAVAQHVADLLRALRLHDGLGHEVPVFGHLVVVIVGGNVRAGKHAARRDALKERKVRRVHPLVCAHALASFSLAISSGTTR